MLSNCLTLWIRTINFFSGIEHTRLFNFLDRRNSRILTTSLDNKAPLWASLFKIGKSSAPLCSFYLSACQNNVHILFQCPALAFERLTLLESLTRPLSLFNHYPSMRDHMGVPESIRKCGIMTLVGYMSAARNHKAVKFGKFSSKNTANSEF